MDPEDEKPSEDAWGNDPISEEITAQIAAMPDRPRVVLALINWVPEADAQIHAAFTFCQEAFLSVMPLKIFGRAFRIYYFGFDSDSSVLLGDFLRALGGLDFSEAAVYTDGVPVLRLSKLKIAPPRPPRKDRFAS